MKSWQLPRRTFLKGVGASILLPALDAMVPSDAFAQSLIGPRLAVLFIPTGIYGQGLDVDKNGKSRYYLTTPYDANGAGAWRPKNTGPLNAPLPPVLGPLEALKDQLTIISGLSTLPDTPLKKVTPHSLATGLWITGAWDNDSKGRLSSPPNSIDQALANSLGYTPGSTIVFNPNHSGGQTGGGTSKGGYHGAISFNSQLGGNHIVPQSKRPKEIFDRLFGNCQDQNNNQGPSQAQVTDKNILDRVIDSIKEVKKKLGTEDKIRLESYLQHIEDIEKSVNQAEKTANQCPEALEIGGEDWFNQVAAMVDVVALALATDKMPVATLMQGTEAYNNFYSEFISLYGNFTSAITGKRVTFRSKTTNAHFDVAHIGTLRNGENGIRAIEEFIAYSRMQMLFTKRLMEKLGSMPVEPNGMTPLDNSLILTGTCHSDAQSHNSHNVPTILAGGKKYGLKQGHHVAFPTRTDRGDFLYTMLKQLGWPGNNFNGNTRILPGIFT